jgi:hypothetical protein
MIIYKKTNKFASKIKIIVELINITGFRNPVRFTKQINKQ